MISSIIILLFQFIYSAGKEFDIDKKINDEKQELIKGIKTDLEGKDLQSLFEKSKGSFKDFAENLFDNPLSTQPDDLKYYEYILWGLDQGQNAVKKVFLDIKKNDPNNSYYKEYRINIELYLKHFKLRILNKLIYFIIHGLIFLGGFFLSILICYWLRKK